MWIFHGLASTAERMSNCLQMEKLKAVAAVERDRKEEEDSIDGNHWEINQL